MQQSSCLGDRRTSPSTISSLRRVLETRTVSCSRGRESAFLVLSPGPTPGRRSTAPRNTPQSAVSEGISRAHGAVPFTRRNCRMDATLLAH